MLGRTASNLFWMSRYMERAENVARLTEVGHRMSLTPDVGGGYREDWHSTLTAAGCADIPDKGGKPLTAEAAQQYLLFDRTNPSSVISCLEIARHNGRSVRTALTRDVWEALNATWIEFGTISRDAMGPAKLPGLMDWVRERSALFRGAVQGSLLRDEGFHFIELGTYVELSDNTARIPAARCSVGALTVLPSGSVTVRPAPPAGTWPGPAAGPAGTGAPPASAGSGPPAAGLSGAAGPPPPGLSPNGCSGLGCGSGLAPLPPGLSPKD
jgi:uncharacterized alpha-E superfamily protein